MKVLTLRVKSNISTKINIQLTYMTSPASWSVEYDFILNNNDDDDTYNLIVNGHASIIQKTNENWDNVDITLTTASAANIMSHTSPYATGIYFQEEEEEEVESKGGVRSFATSHMYMKQRSIPVVADAMAEYVAEPMAQSSAFGNLQSAYRFHIINRMNISSGSNINIIGNSNNRYSNTNNGYNDDSNGRYSNANGVYSNANGYNNAKVSMSPSPIKNRVMIKHLSVTGINPYYLTP